MGDLGDALIRREASPRESSMSWTMSSLVTLEAAGRNADMYMNNDWSKFGTGERSRIENDESP